MKKAKGNEEIRKQKGRKESQNLRLDEARKGRKAE